MMNLNVSMREKKKSIITTKTTKIMLGEIAEIKIHLYKNGMVCECDDTGDGEMIVGYDLNKLAEFINRSKDYFKRESNE